MAATPSNKISKIWETLPEIFSAISESTNSIRNRIVGTLTLTAILIAVFQVEIVVASSLEYSTSRELLQALSKEFKVLIAAVAGPFIHQGPRHLIGNLGMLLIAGGYLEYEYDQHFLYVFYLSVGYLAAWAPLTIGFSGAIGASGVTFGLTSWLLIHSTSRLLEMAYSGNFDRRAWHVLPFAFGFLKAHQTIEIIPVISGADDVTHLFGAFLGMIIGATFVLQFHGIGFRKPEGE
ncbi:rhomboid family intramembrane serine protease [Halosimplex amylolyticum]|uniref:rhomboid family intramembrane serine protease n=1 Tax=Halosimplex amylolyticum TaxID=3396616 RepID=UPI003F56A8EA